MIKNCILVSLIALGMWSEEILWKMEKNSRFLFTTILQ